MDIEELVQKAENAEQIGNLHAAGMYYKAALEMEPQNYFVLFRYGWVALRDNDATKGKELLKKAILYNPQLKAPHLLLGDYYLNKEEYELAFAEFESVLQLDAQNTVALINLSYLFLRKGEKEQALSLLERVKNRELASEQQEKVNSLLAEIYLENASLCWSVRGTKRAPISYREIKNARFWLEKLKNLRSEDFITQKEIIRMEQINKRAKIRRFGGSRLLILLGIVLFFVCLYKPFAHFYAENFAGGRVSIGIAEHINFVKKEFKEEITEFTAIIYSLKEIPLTKKMLLGLKLPYLALSLYFFANVCLYYLSWLTPGYLLNRRPENEQVGCFYFVISLLKLLIMPILSLVALVRNYIIFR